MTAIFAFYTVSDNVFEILQTRLIKKRLPHGLTSININAQFATFIKNEAKYVQGFTTVKTIFMIKTVL